MKYLCLTDILELSDECMLFLVLLYATKNIRARSNDKICLSVNCTLVCCCTGSLFKWLCWR